MPNFILPLVLTIIIEFIIYAVIVRKNILKILGYSFLINSFTNPLLNFILGFGANLILMEFLVFFIEIPLIKYLFEIKWWKALVISLIANLASFFFGLFIFNIFI